MLLSSAPQVGIGHETTSSLRSSEIVSRPRIRSLSHLKQFKCSELKRKEKSLGIEPSDFSFCSAGRDRTYDQLVTFILLFLIGMDYIIIHVGCGALRTKILWHYSFRIVSTPSNLIEAGLARYYPRDTRLGFTEFTPFSIRLSTKSCVMPACISL